MNNQRHVTGWCDPILIFLGWLLLTFVTAVGMSVCMSHYFSATLLEARVYLEVKSMVERMLVNNEAFTQYFNDLFEKMR